MGSAVYHRSELIEVVHMKDRRLSYGNHNHCSVYTIGLVLRGHVVLRRDKQFFQHPRDSFFVIEPYQVHALELPHEYELLSLCLNKRLMIEYSSDALFRLLVSVLTPLLPNLNRVLLSNALNVLFSHQEVELTNTPIAAGAHFLLQNPESSVRVKEIAGAAHYSQYHYSRKFKQTVGLTPHRFHLQSKIRRAQRMIEDGVSSSEIVTALGFFDQSHFIKSFKTLVALTPSDYKMAVKQLDWR